MAKTRKTAFAGKVLLRMPAKARVELVASGAMSEDKASAVTPRTVPRTRAAGWNFPKRIINQ